MKVGHGSHPLGTHGWLRLLVAAALVLVLTLTLEASPAAGASRRACRVRDTDTDQTYPTLQAAVDAARPGAHLVVKGTCVGETVITKDLVIIGVRTQRLGKPTLSGAGKTRVLTVRARVKLRDLDIRRGWVRKGVGAGIRNLGVLTLADVTVQRCETHYLYGSGGGIYNAGRLVLNGRTRIARNGASGAGGIDNEGTLILNGSSRVVRNGSYVGAGGISNAGARAKGVWVPKATLILNGSSVIAGNRSSEGTGGVWNGGTLTMNDSSAIRDNAVGTDEWGGNGGVENHFRATITMNDSSAIAGNRLGGVGNAGRFTMSGSSSIHGNTGNWQGGSVLNYGKFTMSGSSSIHDNTGNCGGGGVLDWGGRFTMSGSSSITGNTASERRDVYCNWAGGPRGGGVYVKSDKHATTILTMRDSAVITGNTVSCDYLGCDGDDWGNPLPLLGGGIYAEAKVSLDGVSCGTQTGANVYGNTPDDCYLEP